MCGSRGEARWLAAILALLLAPPAVAQPVPSPDLAEEAELHFQLGVDLYRSRDFRGALEHMLLSNRLVPNHNVVFNIARCYEKLGDFGSAFRHYDQYSTTEPDPSRRAAAEEALERIAGEVAVVAVVTEPPGATVYFDRRDLGARGTTPLRQALEPGAHQVLLDLDGYRSVEAEVEAVLGEQAGVQLVLERVLGEVRVQGRPEGAAIHIDNSDGEPLAHLPTTLGLVPGARVLVVDAPGHYPQQVVVEVEPDQHTVVAVDLPVQVGSVVVDALERDALVEIDGTAAGFTPVVVEVPVGRHHIRVSMPGFRPFEREVEVGAGADVRVDARLRSHREVTAASRTTEAVEEAPASVSIITAQEIRAFGYTSLYEALATTRGFFQTDDLSYQSVGVRGFGRTGDYGNRVLTTLDGHTLNDDQLGASYVSTDLSVDLEDVEQIEVVRGPGSALYGTNALLGVVNIVTRERQIVPSHLVLSVGEDRTLRARARAGFGGEEAGGWVSAGGLASQGSDYRWDELEVPGDGWIRDASGSEAATGHARAWWQDLEVQGFVSWRDKRVPSGAYGTAPGDARHRNEDLRGFAEVRWEPEPSDSTRLFARAWVDHYRYGGVFPYPGDLLSEERWVGTWLGVEPRVVSTPTDGVELTAGGEVRAYVFAHLYGEDTDGIYLSTAPTQQVLAGYAQADLGTGPVRAILGGRYDHYTLRDVEDRPIGGSFNPRAAVVLAPRDDDVVKLLAGTAFRAPSPLELYYNDDGFSQIPAVGLGPERVASGELEYTHRFDEVTTGTAALFANEVTRLIDLVPTGEAGPEGEILQYQNTDDRLRTVGLEVELLRVWRRGSMLGLSHSLQRAREGDLLGRRVPINTPWLVVGAKAAAPVLSQTVATRVVVESPRRTTDGDSTRWGVLWDLTLTGDLQVVPVSYAIGLRNLLDWKAEFPGGWDLVQPTVPRPGRSVFARVELEI